MGQTFSSFSWPSSDSDAPYVFDRISPLRQSHTPLISFNLFTLEINNIHPVCDSSSFPHRRCPVPKSIDSYSHSDDEDLIPKPMGAAGRPGGGGYKLTKALNWHRRDYYHDAT
ncbi:hypothetical protein HYPSUDRAFT_912985 [Hypholoma sublateritium FD-334 SS-4]|uniref:Uncharacterized protein n=1 Tax=Hypholoma sublateritium (strain FD-334 SS-4) TaxID=945553 RepID=A0A0D2NJ66_HYPSF|nr:hypothetical protein HYPSUDRAFT_912985 [Hypholoma sublateritium FD-334 SS-4]